MLGGNMTDGPPFTLRQVAWQLAQVMRLPWGQAAVPQLLGLLKAGELKAGFEFPGTKVYWIPISMSYWTGISSHRFGTVWYAEGDDYKKGIFVVRINEFADEYVEIVARQSGG